MEKIQIPYELYKEMKSTCEKATRTLDDYPVMLCVKEVQTILSISRSKTYELIGSGELRCVRIGRSIRVRRSELARFLGEETFAG